MVTFRFEVPLIECLTKVAANLTETGIEPLFLGECPNKFNDANHDDLWYAVQAGTAYWEQSHFFEYSSGPLVREYTSYPTQLDVETIKQSGSTIVSDQISYLREKLRLLQKEGWRDLCGCENLSALVIERGQPWFVLETPNGSDGDVYSWDKDGMFRMGGVSRIDQNVGKESILIFKTIDGGNVRRLGAGAKAYFEPHMHNKKSGEKLAKLLWDVTLRIRELSNRPFALRSIYSRQNSSDNSVYQRPQSYSSDLRRNEGELRKPTDGKWPMYRGRPDEELTEYTDIAKMFHTCLGELEDADWRSLFGDAFGETVEMGQHLSLFADANLSVLMRDNVAFEVTPLKLARFGVFNYPDLGLHEKVFDDFRNALG